MADEDDQGGADAAEAFEAMRGELALLRRAVEGLAAERGAIDVPDYTETLGELQRDANTAAENLGRIGQFLKTAPALAMTPEQMTQRIVAAGAAARREDQAALAKAGEDKARVMAELRTLAGSAWTRAEQKNRQLWVGLGGLALGILAWATLPGLVAREIAPTSWQWPERMAARTLDRPMWDAGQQMMNIAAPENWRAIVAGDKVVTANREVIERCRKAATAAKPTRCTIVIEAERPQLRGR